MLSSLEKWPWLQRRACYGVVSHTGAIYPTSTQLLWAAFLRNSRGKLPQINYSAKSLSPFAFGKVNVPMPLLSLVPFLSRCYAPAAYPECCHRNTTAISHTVGVHTPAVLPNYLSWLLSFKFTLIGCKRIKLYENLTLHRACGYCVKLQCQEYMECDICKLHCVFQSSPLLYVGEKGYTVLCV